MGRQRKERPDGFVLYIQSMKTLEILSDEAAGKAIKAAIAHFLRGAEMEYEQSAEFLAYSVMCVDIDESLSRFREKCERNRKNRHGGDKQEAVTTGDLSPPVVTSGDQLSPVVTSGDHNRIELNRTELNRTELNRTELKNGADELPDAFDVFWAAYPRKRNKEAARRAFKKVKAPLQTLLDSIDRQKQDPQWKKDGGQYIPYPAKWLNAGAWENETEVANSDQHSGDDSEGPNRWHGYDITPDVY